MAGKDRGSRFTGERSNYDDGVEVTTKKPPTKKYKSNYSNRATKSSSKDRGKKRKKSSRSWLKSAVVLLIIVLLIGAVFFTPLFESFRLPGGGGRVYPEKADFTIQRTISLQNRDAQVIDYNLTLAVPEDIQGNEIQIVEDMYYNLEPVFHKKYGTEWKSWDRDLSPRGSESIRVSYDVKTSTVSWGYSGDDAGEVSDVSEDLKDKYNKNQWQLDEDRNGDGEDDWMIQPDHPEIESLSEDIVRGEDNIYDKSKALYDWIDNNIEYDLETEGLPKHAVWTLESGSGDCDEQSFLYASLSRAVGIPAWMEMGVLYDRVGQRWGGHGWIRTNFVREDGSSGWVNIDPVNDQFYFRDATRITTWVDEGGEDYLENFYYYISWRGGNLRVKDDFEDIQMDTEGKVLAGDGWSIPGFSIGVIGTAIIISLVVYTRRRKKSSNSKKKNE